MTRNLDALTSLRGIAAVFIVVHHITVYFIPGINQNISVYTPFLQKSYLWVDFFFILSGFILSHVYWNVFSGPRRDHTYRHFLVARFARIYPIHFAMILILILFEIMKLILGEGRPFSRTFTIESLFFNLLLVQAFLADSTWNQPAWSISAEWLLYLTLPLLIRGAKDTSKKRDWVIVLACYTLLVALSSQTGSLDFVSWKSVLRCGSEMTIGIMAYKHRFNVRTYLGDSVESLVLLLFVLVSIYLPISHIVSVVLFALLVVSASKISENRFYTNGSLMFLGKISYSIYMIHWPFFVFVKYFVKYFFNDILHQNMAIPIQIVVALSLLLAVIFLAIPMYHYIENPIRHYIKNGFHSRTRMAMFK